MVGLGKDDRAGAESSVTVQRFPTGDVVVHVVGELLNARAMVQAIADVLNPLLPRLAVDLLEVTRVDLAGVHALTTVAEAAGESDISLCLIVEPGGPVEAAIAAADLTELFEVFPSINEAW